MIKVPKEQRDAGFNAAMKYTFVKEAVANGWPETHVKAMVNAVLRAAIKTKPLGRV